MWKEYSVKYMKSNRAAGVFIMAVAFLSSMLLTLLGGLFYNLWMDRSYRLYLTTGSKEGEFGVLPAAYAFLLAAAVLSLVLMLYNAFEVTMNSRIHQMGILQSVGATPRQLRRVLLQEAFVLSGIPLLVGMLAGAGVCYGFWKFAEVLGEGFRTYELRFYFHPVICISGLLAALLTILISAWIPAVRLGKLSPMEAIFYGGEQEVVRMKRFRLVSALFGIYGELARKSLYARRKSLRMSAWSLTLSCLAFIGFLNLETISGMSTQETYFERYRDKWDYFLTVEEGQADEGLLSQQIRSLPGMESCIVYRKLETYTKIAEDQLSQAVGNVGIGNLTEEILPEEDGSYLVKSLIYALDEESFRAYCEESGIKAEEGEHAILINRIWDSVHSDRRNREYIPFLRETEGLSLELWNRTGAGADPVSVEVMDHTEQLPEWKEEIPQYTLALLVNEAVYERIRTQFPAGELFYNIKTKDSMETYGEELELLSAGLPGCTLESRVEEEQNDQLIRRGLRIFAGMLAGLFSSIGLSNVFSASLGQIYQRKKEFARYLSVGLSPRGMHRLLFMEALFVALRPMCFGILFNVPLALILLRAGGFSVGEYARHIPFVPILIFLLFILFFVGLAYYLGGRKICTDDMVEVLKDETMV
ncbi:MAG: ABC transporter permease [Clostridiales bacterium]|nr:ABC transporter permease [Clostridiales bacterium]